MKQSIFSTAWRNLQLLTGWLPFSWGGAVFLLASVVALRWFGIARSDLVMVVLGAVGIALCALGLVLTLLAGVWVYFHLRNYRENLQSSLVVGIPTQTGFSVKLPWWFPLVQLKWAWEHTDFFVQLEGQKESVQALRRGEWEQIRRQVSVGDAFGICEIRFPFVQEVRLRVIPNTKDLMSPKIVQGLQAGADVEHPLGKPQGDRLDIRNYAQGDPMRYILWKVYARTGALVVRTPERAYQPTKKMLSYLIVSEDDQVGAAMAMVALQGELLGQDWSFGVDGSTAVFSQRELALQAIIGSGASEQRQASGLAQFVSVAQEDGSSLLVFAPPRKGEWVKRVLAISERLPVSVVICAEGVSDSGFLSAFREVLFLPDEIERPAMVEHEEIREVVSAFEGSKAHLTIVLQRSQTIGSAVDFRRSV